jgi:hypothetical protein
MSDHPTDPVSIFGRPVIDSRGQSLGRVTALVHRGDGCDVLIERRHWLRHKVVRVDIDDLRPGDRGVLRHLPSAARTFGPSDGWVA